ncbi:MAG: DUF2062 domain-containing protein [Verrucomicrobiales bacterium]|nr:DUF2062 domain-containing protein [Verrucomicrobiales bacterium]
MLTKTRVYLRRAVFRMYRRLKHPRHLKKRPVMRWFARHFLDQAVWRPCQATFAGGVAVGCFVGMQLIPGQMPLAVVLSALFRVNIPVAVVVSWLSNPLTFAPIGYAELQFGRWLMSLMSGKFEAMMEVANEDVRRGLQAAQEMYLGGVVSGLLLAPVGYAASWFGWTGIAKLLHIPAHRPPRVKPPTATAAQPPAVK